MNGKYDTEDAEVDDYIYRNKMSVKYGLNKRKNSTDIIEEEFLNNSSSVIIKIMPKGLGCSRNESWGIIK